MIGKMKSLEDHQDRKEMILKWFKGLKCKQKQSYNAREINQHVFDSKSSDKDVFLALQDMEKDGYLHMEQGKGHPFDDQKFTLKKSTK